jgi:hypothetical protein
MMSSPHMCKAAAFDEELAEGESKKVSPAWRHVHATALTSLTHCAQYLHPHTGVVLTNPCVCAKMEKKVIRCVI